MSDERPPLPLDRLGVGEVGQVQVVAGPHVRDLVREGLLPGARVRLRSRAPLGGPVIVELEGSGQASAVALSRAVAAGIRVMPEPVDGR